MPEVFKIIEFKHIIPYLEARKLFKQYQKAKGFLLAGDRSRVHFKQRQPKDSGTWSFRINKQFRAFGFFREDGVFAVSDIDNHQ